MDFAFNSPGWPMYVSMPVSLENSRCRHCAATVIAPAKPASSRLTTASA
jgi:hypothetical protein